MKANRWSLLLVPMLFAFIALTAWTGCDRKPTEKPVTPPDGTAAPVSPETIELGATFPLTGDVASYGQKAKRGIELAVAEVNEKGGVLGRQVSVDFQDDRHDSKEVETPIEF